MVDSEFSGNPRNTISSQRLSPSGRSPDGLAPTMSVVGMRGVSREADQEVVLVDEQMELKMSPMINDVVDDGVDGGRSSSLAANTANMKVERRKHKPSMVNKTNVPEKGESSLIQGSWFQALAGCEDNQQLNTENNLQSIVVVVPQISTVTAAFNNNVAAESNKQQSTVVVFV
ncbi:hypothetical protein V6N13_048940 [Hibiscus sabdariffa]|uniref:Uncharacterized protein n=1 Tax=Hibiscus sabdariffa TaxID=183260 RepID=A0ABR2QYN4_9ROSI